MSPLPLPLLARGKVRDVYEVDAHHLLLVASDRLSAYDVVLPTTVPDKGAVLTALSLWWFDRLADVVPNHLVGWRVRDLPDVLRPHADQLRGRTMLVRRLAMVPVECVARGYLTGSGMAEYRVSGTVCGLALPEGLVEASRLPEPLFTPTTKAPVGQHDAPITFGDVVTMVGPELAESLRATTLSLYTRGAQLAAEAGILLADTKVELGHDADGKLTLGDEVLTPDSSRFWPAAGWQPGQVQPSYDKQYVRDWLSDTGWDKKPPGPELPADVVARTRDRYVQAYERLTGQSFEDYLRDA
ncbi:MAG: phosphoribosylaminoimidazolesuccinocarboxamide synthase [Actinomycetota bacterium]|nr:phosphoribosylaminoimidazolesuccinocarboxamide synthase [Actinomycetota bacterium]